MSILKGVKDEIPVHVTAKIYTGLGKSVSVRFKPVFRKLKRDELQEITRDVESQVLTDGELIREHLLGWSGLKGHEDQEVPFSDEALDEMLGEIGYVRALVEGFMEAQGVGAALKN